MISFATASHLSLAGAGLYYRLIRARTSGGWRCAALLLLLPLTLLTHVWSFAILVVPDGGALPAWLAPDSRGGPPAVWGLPLLALAVNLTGWCPRCGTSTWLLPRGWWARPSLCTSAQDWLELLVNPINTGFAIPHTLLRFAAICGAALTLWRWRKERDERLFFGRPDRGLAVRHGLLASLIPGLRETEPYRFVMPGMCWRGSSAQRLVQPALHPPHLDRGSAARVKACWSCCSSCCCPLDARS